MIVVANCFSAEWGLKDSFPIPFAQLLHCSCIDWVSAFYSWDNRLTGGLLCSETTILWMSAVTGISILIFVASFPTMSQIAAYGMDNVLGEWQCLH